MKNLFFKLVLISILVMGLVVIAIPTQAISPDRPIWTEAVISAQTVAKSSSYTTPAYDLSGRKFVTGYFSLQVAVTGSGTCKFEYLISNDGVNYLEPSAATDIASSITVSSGPGSDGKDIFRFRPIIGKYMKIKVTETGTSAAVVVTAYLSIQ